MHEERSAADGENQMNLTGILEIELSGVDKLDVQV